MRDQGGGETARSDLVLFAACILLALLALALPRPWAESLTNAIRRTALRPMVAAQSRAVADRTAREGLRAIEHTRDSLALLVQAFGATRRENDNLRALLDLRPRLTQPYLPAEILHQPAVTDDRMALLNVGAADGVHQFDPVVTGAGLVGYVWSTSPHSSAAYTWTHPEFRAAAVTANGSVTGLVSASPSTDASRTVLQLRGVALRDSLAVGTPVFTSGLGGVFPRGIPIGRVSAIERDQFGYERVYRITPYSHPALATHVLVLTTPRDSLFLPLPPSDSARKADSLRKVAGQRMLDSLRKATDSLKPKDSIP
ncbi:MAG: rod shape-determining protein MreC [Gemmatimonadales bacterium]